MFTAELTLTLAIETDSETGQKITIISPFSERQKFDINLAASI